MKSHYIVPSWTAPRNVKAFTTTKYENFDFSLQNPKRDFFTKSLIKRYNVPKNIFWLEQTHSTKVVDLDNNSNASFSSHRGLTAGSTSKDYIDADASFTAIKKTVCAVITADCLPVFITNSKGSKVAAIHAGWRGLLNGIIENTIKQFKCNGKELIIWLGPAIGPEKFEVGNEVKESFLKKAINKDIVNQSFINIKENKYLANIYMLAIDRLLSMNVLENKIFCENYCTFSETDKFYSFRRDAASERMASIIWLH